MVHLPQDNGLPRFTTSPFFQGGMSIAVQDNDPADGWLLLMRDFGTPERGQPIPYLLLYNRYQGLLRIFVYIDTPDTFSEDSGIELFHGTATQTALLTFLKPRAFAPDQVEEVGENRSLAATPVANGYWSFAEFPIAYDPYLAQRGENAQLLFRVWGIQNYKIFLSGSGDLRQVFGSSQPTNIPSDGWALPGVLSVTGKSVQASYATWKGWSEGFKKTANDINPGGFKAIQTLKDKLLDLSTKWIPSNLGFIGAGVGLVEFLVTGGRRVNQEQPAPMNFQLGVTLNGTMESRRVVSPGVTLPVPGAPHTTPVIPVNLLYNQPLGIFNLLETPIIQYRARPPMTAEFGQGPLTDTFDIAGVAELERNVIPEDMGKRFHCLPTLPPEQRCYLARNLGAGLNGENSWWLINRQGATPATNAWSLYYYADRTTQPPRIRGGEMVNARGLQLQVKNNLRWQVNPASDLKLESLSAAIVFRAPSTSVYGSTVGWDYYYLRWSEGGTDQHIPDLVPGAIDPTWVELESSSNDFYLFRTPYVDASSLRYRRIDVATLPDVAIKVNAILRRKDAAPGDQPVVFVATYQPEIEYWNFEDPWPTFDLNYDGCVDRSDLDLLMAVIRGRANPDPFWSLDMNGDGKIDIADARALVTHFNKTKGEACGQ